MTTVDALVEATEQVFAAIVSEPQLANELVERIANERGYAPNLVRRAILRLIDEGRATIDNAARLQVIATAA
ncbi:MAG: hypothetical protein AB7F65_10300 [Dehalococcoidia bacterium]